ncbi:MAG: cytochrome c peroxidase [Gammaproteobacteria bacterium]|jgi:cytochrome c peroxidase
MHSHQLYLSVRALSFLRAASAALLLASAPVAAELPDVPIPPENPQSEAKRVLGKILFWEEQLSYDDTVACGTCHLPASGGSDPRAGRHPGIDPGTIDDVRGSPGIAYRDAEGQLIDHPIFGRQLQVTPRTAPANFLALWAESIFWDGRAGPQFRDPISGEILIAAGGALEAQALAALSNPAEMARSGHDWDELTAKLSAATPLALASALPADIRKALEGAMNYPALFAAAFGESDITAARIAFAIAAYQRTLIADETAWDRLQAGDTEALSESATRGWRDFQAFHCDSCHVPPLFTNNDFANIGLRLARFDNGRMSVTGEAEDAGEMKVPSLRNVALRPRFMHTGQFGNLGAAIGFYLRGTALEHRDNLPNGSIYSFNMGTQSEIDIRAFLEEGLTDPRVRDEIFPFDRPTLGSERIDE